MEKESIYLKTAKYIKDNSTAMRKMGVESKSMPMETCLSDNLWMEKNMDKENFIGLPFLLAILSQTNMSSTTKDNGGEDCLMVLECIKKSMGIYIQEYSKMD